MKLGAGQIPNAHAIRTFSLLAPGAEQVFLAGSFNGWNASATPMARDGDRWTAAVKVPYGKILYKFVVDGSQWKTDPSAKTETDPSGNVNSVLLVLPPDYAAPAHKDDGVVAESALFHDTEIPYRNVDRGRLTLSFRARPNDLRRIVLASGQSRVEMTPIGSDDLYETYRASLPWSPKKPIEYRFLLDDGKRIRSYGDYRIDPKYFRPFVVPTWVERSVIYQIFPDRFEDGSKANDPEDAAKWTDKPTWYNFFGGDLQGIEKRIPYLKGLGIQTIYLNPIFKSPSNHRYDAEDFRAVDPRVGTNDDFVRFVHSVHMEKMKVVLDFAYNHTAPGFFAFDDLLKNQQESAYKDWYFVRRFPVKVQMPPNYEAWWGFAGMPKLNARNPEVRKYLLDTTRYWVGQVGIDGMRLDVPNEVDSSLWRAMRPVVKGYGDKWIVGEIWDDGTPWLKGDQFDSVMNYPFRTACVKFIAEGSETSSQFAQQLMSTYTRYAPQVGRNLMNLLSSHDTERFLTLCGGNRDLQKLAATIQLTWVGTPSIYYGEELGMEGGKDPDNRRAMRWDLATSSNDLLTYYKKLIALRTRTAALQSGDPTILLTDDSTKTLAFARILASDSVLTLVNRDTRPHTLSFSLSDARTSLYRDSLSGRTVHVSGGHVSFTLGPLQAAVLLPEDRAALHSARKGLDNRNPLLLRSHQR